jgi:glycosyltransferase involved in cell wall biosynthesis
MSLPLISIVMIAHNEELNIGRSIKSIQNQTFKEWELIIINDGSFDKTIEIIKNYSLKDNRIRLINNKKKIGRPKCSNLGIQHSRAELIARLDADDISLPDRLDKQYKFLLKNSKIDVVGAGAFVYDKNHNFIKTVLMPKDHNSLKNLNFLKTPFFHSSVIIRKCFFDKVGNYDVNFLRSSDKELWLRGLKYGAVYSNLFEPLIEFTQNNYTETKMQKIILSCKSLVQLKNIYKPKFGNILIMIYFFILISRYISKN